MLQFPVASGVVVDKSDLTSLNAFTTITGISSYSTVLEITGKGFLDVVTIEVPSASARAGIRITMDDAVVADIIAPTAAVNSASRAAVLKRDLIFPGVGYLASNGIGTNTLGSPNVTTVLPYPTAAPTTNSSSSGSITMISEGSMYFKKSLKIEVYCSVTSQVASYSYSGGYKS